MSAELQKILDGHPDVHPTTWERIKRTSSVAANAFKTVGIAFLLVFTVLQSARNGAIVDKLNDCLTPGGVCYQRNQERTGGAIVSITDVAKMAAVCADQKGSITAEEMDTCIKAQLAKEGKK